MCRNRSDKGSSHNYTTLYYSIFKDICKKKLRIFELGLGTNNITIPSNMGKMVDQEHLFMVGLNFSQILTYLVPMLVYCLTMKK